MCSRRRVALGVSLLAAACFDTEQVDISTRVTIDDFEDGDQIANGASGFGLWWCASSSGDGPEAMPSCELSAGFESTFAESLTFSLRETSSADYPQAWLGLSSVGPTRDLRSFTSIRFRAKFEPGEPAPPPDSRLSCKLACSSAEAQPDDLNPELSVEYQGETDEGVELPGDWSSYSLPFAAFRQPSWQGRLSEEASCFGLVDALEFRVDPQLMKDGQVAAGTLTIDDVYLE